MNLELGVTIGDLAETIRGVTYEKAEARNSPREGYSPLIRATNIDRGALVLESFVYVPDAVIRDDQRLRVGDIVLAASSGSLSVVGKAALLRSQWHGTFGAFCYAVRPKPERVVPDYLAYFMQTSIYRSRVSKLAAGVNINNLHREHIENIELPLCALAEQKRIVEAVDSYLTRLDDAAASLERVQTKLQAYRASVLKAAVEGRLVPTEASLARAERRDYEPAEVLLSRVLQERRRRWEEAELVKLKASGKTPRDGKWKSKYREPVAPDTRKLPRLPEGWCWASLDQLLHLLRNGQSMAPREETGVRTLRISAVRPLAVDFNDVRYLPGDPVDYQDDLVEVGDLLFTRYNGTPSLVGVCGCVRALTEPTVHPDKLIKVRLCSDLHVPYVELAANAGESRSLIERRTRTTAGQAGISGSDLKQMPIPVPPLSEQVRIGDEVERLVSVADETKGAVAIDERRCARLRQAVLKWAFEGKLVDQYPRDEVADRLLARIRAERAAALRTKKKGGRRAKGAA